MSDLKYFASAVARIQLLVRKGDIQAAEALEHLSAAGDPSLLFIVLTKQIVPSSPDVVLWHELAAIANAFANKLSEICNATS